MGGSCFCFVFQSLFVWSEIQLWSWQRKGSWGGILKRYTGAKRKICLPNAYAGHKVAGFETIACINARILHQIGNLDRVATIAFFQVSPYLSRSHSKTTMRRKPFSRQQMAALTTLEMKSRSWKPSKGSETLPQYFYKAMWRNGCECERAAYERELTRVSVFHSNLTIWWIWHVLCFHQCCFWRHKSQGRARYLPFCHKKDTPGVILFLMLSLRV